MISREGEIMKNEVNIDEIKKEYREIRGLAAYANCKFSDFQEFDQLMIKQGAKTPQEFILAARAAYLECGQCEGTGEYKKHGQCYRCGGKGKQTVEDMKRNFVYDVKYRIHNA